jgi:hypothetical protein
MEIFYRCMRQPWEFSKWWSSQRSPQHSLPFLHMGYITNHYSNTTPPSSAGIFDTKRCQIETLHIRIFPLESSWYITRQKSTSHWQKKLVILACHPEKHREYQESYKQVIRDISMTELLTKSELNRTLACATTVPQGYIKSLRAWYSRIGGSVRNRSSILPFPITVYFIY